MALQGNYTHYQYEPHPTETIDEVIAYPANLSEDDVNYEKRGTEEIIQTPKLVETLIPYENCVIGLRTVNLYIINNDDEFNKVVNFNYTFRVYNQHEDKENRYDENFLAEYIETTTIDLEENPNPWAYAYEQIKEKPGGSELINI